MCEWQWKIFKEEKPIEILKTLGLIKYIYTYLKSMVEENISQEFRLKHIDGAKNRAKETDE